MFVSMCVCILYKGGGGQRKLEEGKRGFVVLTGGHTCVIMFLAV